MNYLKTACKIFFFLGASLSFYSAQAYLMKNESPFNKQWCLKNLLLDRFVNAIRIYQAIKWSSIHKSYREQQYLKTLNLDKVVTIFNSETPEKLKTTNAYSQRSSHTQKTQTQQ